MLVTVSCFTRLYDNQYELITINDGNTKIKSLAITMSYVQVTNIIFEKLLQQIHIDNHTSYGQHLQKTKDDLRIKSSCKTLNSP